MMAYRGPRGKASHFFFYLDSYFTLTIEAPDIPRMRNLSSPRSVLEVVEVVKAHSLCRSRCLRVQNVNMFMFDVCIISCLYFVA
jgi:hypothetical protein